MGRHSETLSLISGCSSPTCSLAGRSRLTPYQTRFQHRTNERLQTRLVRTRLNASWKPDWVFYLTVGTLCVSVHPGLIFCKVSLGLSVLAVTCRGTRPTAVPLSFFIFFRCSSKLHSLSFFSPSFVLLCTCAPKLPLCVCLFLSPPLPSCACVCECDSVMWWIFLAANHSVQRWGETSSNVQPASSRIAACAFPSFPLFSSFCFYSFFFSHRN